MKPYKAIFAAISVFIAGLMTALENGDGVSQLEGLSILGAVVAIAGGVYGISNEPEPPEV